MKHFGQLVDSCHIFTANSINNEMFMRGEELINTFVHDFEDLFGGINMVYNVHILKHIPKCVEENGPLCFYTAYNMEDNIGHVVSHVHGTSDVVKQCAQKYMLESCLKTALSTSERAQSFNEKIHFVYRNNKPLSRSNLSIEQRDFIRATINKIPVEEFHAIWIGKDFYRAEESDINSRNRKTYDSFVATNNGKVGTITSIFKTECNSVYMLYREDYIQTNNDICEKVIFLEPKPAPACHIVNSQEIEKAVFIKFDNVIAFSNFPNTIERN